MTVTYLSLLHKIQLLFVPQSSALRWTLHKLKVKTPINFPTIPSFSTMKPARLLSTNLSRPILFRTPQLGSKVNWVYGCFRPPGVTFPVACMATSSTRDTHLPTSPSNITEVGSSGTLHASPSQGKSERWEAIIEKVVFYFIVML